MVNNSIHVAQRNCMAKPENSRAGQGDWLSNATTVQASLIVAASILIMGFVFWVADEAAIMIELAL